MNKYIDSEKLIAEIKKLKRSVELNREHYNNTSLESRNDLDAYYAQELILNSLIDTITSLLHEQPKKRLIQVKCLNPYDESWQKNKVYTCEVWHHGDLNRDFWDVYYDYGKDPKYVQFSSLQMLNEEFAIIQDESKVIPEQPEVELEEALDEYYKIVDWSPSEAIEYDTHKDIARHFAEWGATHFNARKEN